MCDTSMRNVHVVPKGVRGVWWGDVWSVLQ